MIESILDYWEFKTYTVYLLTDYTFMVLDLNDEYIDTIVADDYMEIVNELNNEKRGVDGWENGGGETITIPTYYKNVNEGYYITENEYLEKHYKPNIEVDHDFKLVEEE